MTAVAILRTADGIVVASDGIAYEAETGNVAGFTSKVILAPEWSAVIAYRGAGGFGQMLRSRLGVEVMNFDTMLAQLPSVALPLWLEYRFSYQEDCHFSLLIGGWSDARQRYETYVLRSERVTFDDGVQEPFTLTPLPSAYLAPTPTTALMRDFGVLEAVARDPIAGAVRAVCAARRLENAPGEAARFAVGGFVQLTVLTRDAVESRVVHRWPDPIGEPIDPTRGDALPAWVLERAEQATDGEPDAH